MNKHTTTTSALLVLLVAGSLAACSKTDDQTAGQKLDQTIASGEQKSAEMKADIKQGATDVKDATKDAMATGKQAASDAAITAEVNGALVKDSSLSALKINVDTRDGRVVLMGTAPDATSQTRATQLAQGVKGVQSVDNQLTVK